MGCLGQGTPHDDDDDHDDDGDDDVRIAHHGD